MSHRFLFVLAFALPLAGCELLGLLTGDTIDLPIDLRTPPQIFDVTAAVSSIESGACAEPESAPCATITAICQSEPQRNCDPPTMPDTFPATIDIPPGGPVTATKMMDDLGVGEATEMELALPVDVASALADNGVESNDAVKNVRIGALVLEWPENTLTFDAPPLDLYIANEAIDPGSLDAEALIASGAVERVGTIGLDLDDDGIIDVGQLAGSIDPVPVSFIAGGNELMSAAFRTAEFTVVTAVPEGAGFALKETDGGVAKPTGAGKVQLKATLVFSVNAADIIAAAE